MRRRRLQTVLIGLAAGVLAGTGALAEPATAAPAVAAAPTGPQQVTQVTLVTGDVVTLTTQPDGRQEASVWRANPAGPSGQFQMFKLGSDLYVVPQSAVPYLGSTLDLSLFDVTMLAQAQPATVTTTYRSGATTTAALSQHSGAAFGAALGRQWLADHDSPTHTTGLFATIARLSATSVRSATVQPAFVMHTLTVNGRNQKGQKDTGDSALVYNVDDLRAFVATPTFYKGLVKLSVPEGHYAAFSFFFDFPSGTVRLAALPQFTVSADMSITLDARKATSPVTITTSKPATAALNVLGIGRDDALGQDQPFTFLGSGTNSFYAQPTTQPVTVGKFHYYAYTRRFAPDGTSYSYDLIFPSEGVIPVDQHYVADDSTLAAVDTSYPAGHSDQHALDTRFGALPWQQSVFAANLEFVTPTQRTEYYSARPDLIWAGLDFTVFNSDPFTLLGPLESVWRTYSPGTRLATIWAGQPQHPRLLEGEVFRDETICPACLSGSRLDLLSYPFSDNSPEHYGFTDGSTAGLTESVAYTVSADGSPVRTGGFLDAEMTLPVAQQYRIDYHTVRSSADFPLSTDVLTSWTVPSDVPTGALPAGWVCTIRANPPSSCGVLPLVTASYDLPVDLLGTLTPGTTNGRLHLGHLGGTGAAFTSVIVEVSYDGGQSWQPVSVSDEGAGSFGVAFVVPPSGTDEFGALRITTQDVLGGAFSQTVQHAFAVGA
jgi:hypothetical protein